MGKFDDIIGSWEPDTELPDDWRDQLRGAYTEDFEGAIAKNNELSTQLDNVSSSSAAEISKLKSTNYDLLMQIPSNGNSTDTTNIIDNDDDTDITVEDLFGDNE